MCISRGVEACGVVEEALLDNKNGGLAGPTSLQHAHLNIMLQTMFLTNTPECSRMLQTLWNLIVFVGSVWFYSDTGLNQRYFSFFFYPPPPPPQPVVVVKSAVADCIRTTNVSNYFLGLCWLVVFLVEVCVALIRPCLSVITPQGGEAFFASVTLG